MGWGFQGALEVASDVSISLVLADIEDDCKDLK